MKTTLIIKDEVNCKFEGLELSTRKKLEKELKFMLPHARHVPAYKLGRWDGCVGYFTIGGQTFISCLPKILPIVQSDGYEIVVQDERESHDLTFELVTEDLFSDRVWPVKHPAAGQPIKLRDYQVEIINQFLQTPQCLQEIATGAGKTLITAALSYKCESYGRTIVIVPNKDLVTQTEADYINLGLDVGVYFGDRKDIGRTHTICTWQSLNVLEKRFRDGLNDTGLHEFAEGVVCVMVDEVHQAKADVLKKLLTGAFATIPIRWGLTGTIPKAELERLSLEVSLGEVVNRLSAAELQDKGVLANCNVNVLQLQDTVAYGDYQSELTYLTTNKERLDYMASIIQTMAESGNTLVLVDRIKAGEGLVERLGDKVVFISGSMKSKDRKDEYDEVSEATGKIIVATYGVAAVGINIPRIFNLVLVEPGKSFVRVIQSIGRGIRKAQDKDSVQIWDITSSAKFSKRHLTERKKFYREASYPFQVEKVNYK
jgi:superfamily II DNA or RNA helicase|tara:strand:+ start:3432 stop:4886 length:1455 start_codon:yes stop_codon:yes gene_type:complete